MKFEVKKPKGKIIDPGAHAVVEVSILLQNLKETHFLGSGVSIGIDRLVFCLLQKKEFKNKEKKPVLICVMETLFRKIL